jgi:hypothetical protein
LSRLACNDLSRVAECVHPSPCRAEPPAQISLDC